jgi:hypothetical protein
MYWRSEQNDLSGFIESNWAKDRETRKSTCEYVFTLGSSPVTWCSKWQPTIARQSIEIEYKCLMDGAK